MSNSRYSTTTTGVERSHVVPTTLHHESRYMSAWVNLRPDADQPVSKLFMATEGIGVDGVRYSLNEPKSGSLSMYSSFTNRKGNDVLWYSDSKFFLLGKRITEAFLYDMKLPAK